MITHTVNFNERRSGRYVVADCGDIVDRSEVVEDGATPTCTACVRYNEQTAEDMFGTDARIRSFGPTVESRIGNPTAGYRPKEKR